MEYSVIMRFLCVLFSTIKEGITKHKDYQPIGEKIIVCADCSEEVVVDSMANNRERCDACIRISWNKYNAAKQREYYKNKKSV